MAIKVGINGFGRIGRLVFRAAIKNPKDIEVVGINDLFDAEATGVHAEVRQRPRRASRARSKRAKAPLVVNGKKIRLTAEKDPANLKWGDVGAEYVCESTGFFLDKAKAEGHIKAGAKKVVVMSAPSKDDTPMFVMGVNHKSYKGEAYRLQRLLHDQLPGARGQGAERQRGASSKGLMTTVHATTATQKTVDGPGGKKDLRGGRARLEQHHPVLAPARPRPWARSFPALKGKLTGMAFRVPTAERLGGGPDRPPEEGAGAMPNPPTPRSRPR